MEKKSLLLLIIGLIVAFVLGFGGIWLVMGGNQSHKEKKTKDEEVVTEHQEAAAVTATVDMFQLTLPCQRDAEGNTPIVHTDLQLVVPIKHRLKVEEKASQIRDIIATHLRNTDVTVINKDMEGFKKEIIHQVQTDLNVDIEEILVLRFDYDILRAKH